MPNPAASQASRSGNPLTRRFYGWLELAALVIGLDQLSKWLVLSNMNFGDNIPVTGFFQLVLVYNPGAAFSFLADHSGWQRWFFIALALGVCGWLLTLLRQHQRETILPLAFSLIIGGAIGNVVDRVVHGAVVDFLYFHIGRYGWPAFNVADSAITVGVALMLWAQFRAPRTTPTSENPS
ncbi:signal peptidase II [Aromatoleum diolicum]|uniref:Lipoprotein signal peptidase n=1 Tax=Aromatoleum diolicum TaxID=75796 RepID=A0ABX1QGC2_9RHOO|nr:signal peptidase II [Aromatoleum diolicum]NMG76993.1 lipoprotein signal peptidase [Aromatoleum diolicum]